MAIPYGNERLAKSVCKTNLVAELPQLACLHDQNKSGFFWKAGFFPTNQGFFKTYQITLIGWLKAGPSKSHFCFDHVNRLNMLFLKVIFHKRVSIIERQLNKLTKD